MTDLKSSLPIFSGSRVYNSDKPRLKQLSNRLKALKRGKWSAEDVIQEALDALERELGLANPTTNTLPAPVPTTRNPRCEYCKSIAVYKAENSNVYYECGTVREEHPDHIFYRQSDKCRQSLNKLPLAPNLAPALRPIASADRIALNDFALFWKEYPNKKAKGAAEKAWLNAARENNLPALDKVLESLARQKQSPDWVKDRGQFIPHPATWINQQRWDDEPIQAPSAKNHDKAFLEKVFAHIGGEK